MSVKRISYKNTGYFSDLVCDYLSKKESLQPFYHRYPSMDHFKEQLREKKSSFNQEQRNVLVDSLNKQYEGIDLSEATKKNIDALLNESSFTITTGHQLNLFTGPIYFLYKIFSVINLSEELKKEYPNFDFIPIYWMAAEDHDFEEINFFNIKGTRIEWDRESNGAVGNLSTEGLEELVTKIESTFGTNKYGNDLISIFKKAYLQKRSLAWATRCLANELFAAYGLVIVDGNDTELKKQFIPYAKKELIEKCSFKEVERTSLKLEGLGYKKQVHPREINLFYITDGLRERIVESNGKYLVNNTQIEFTFDGIIKELNDYPERFSPNALLRPLYQEVISPNLCYIGGGGELAYWFQLKGYFNKVEVPFPMLLLRNSVLLVSKRHTEKLKRLDVEINELFLSKHDLEKEHAKKLSTLEIDFTPQRNFLKKQFKDLFELAKKTDASFVGAVAAQEKKQLNGLDKLEKRLIKAEKRKFADEIERLTIIQEALFPNGSLQERFMNFSEFYLEYGDDLFKTLKNNIEPSSNQFTILELP